MVQQTPAAKLVNKYPHMNVLEPEKLQWMQDLPPSKSLSEACPYNARFSFDGKFSFIIENVSVAKYCSSLDIQIQYSSTCTELPSRLFLLIRYRIYKFYNEVIIFLLYFWKNSQGLIRELRNIIAWTVLLKRLSRLASI